MHPAANHLIQLQELLMIRDEQKIAGSAQHLEQLDASIKTMSETLNAAVKPLFDKLIKKDRVVIVPISDDVCAACGMRLPISLVQAVRIGRDIHSCPNCARMLYYPEAAVKRLGKTPRRMEPQKVGISRFTSQTLMVPKLESEDKEGTIRELAFKMESEGFVDNAAKLVEDALSRENVISTAVEYGIAFPHVRGVEGGGLTLALGLSPKGIKWDTSSQSLTKIVFLIVIPIAASAFYLKLLAGLSECLTKVESRKALLAEKDPEKLLKTLAKLTRTTIK